MQLTAETFLQIVQSLRTDGMTAGHREARKAPRVGIRGRVEILLPKSKGAQRINVSVRDLSAAGIGLLINEPFLVRGEEFLLMLPGDEDHSRKIVVCVVRR